METETIEEAAENHWRLQYVMSLDETTKPYIIEDFKAGAKWVQERMYSEEEVKQITSKLFYSMTNSEFGIKHTYESFEKWFEQHKKK